MGSMHLTMYGSFVRPVASRQVSQPCILFHRIELKFHTHFYAQEYIAMPVADITEEQALVDATLPFRWTPAGNTPTKVSAERAHRLSAMGERISPNPKAFPRGVLSEDAPIFSASPCGTSLFQGNACQPVRGGNLYQQLRTSRIVVTWGDQGSYLGSYDASRMSYIYAASSSSTYDLPQCADAFSRCHT